MNRINDNIVMHHFFSCFSFSSC